MTACSRMPRFVSFRIRLRSDVRPRTPSWGSKYSASRLSRRSDLRCSMMLVKAKYQPSGPSFAAVYITSDRHTGGATLLNSSARNILDRPHTIPRQSERKSSAQGYIGSIEWWQGLLGLKAILPCAFACPRYFGDLLPSFDKPLQRSNQHACIHLSAAIG